MSDAKALHSLEDWSPSPTRKGSTNYLAQLDNFQERVAVAAKRIATLNREKDPLTNNYKRRIKDSFVDTLCFLFDGLLSSAMAPQEVNNGRRPSRVAIVKTVVKDMVRTYPNSTDDIGYKATFDLITIFCTQTKPTTSNDQSDRQSSRN